MKILVSPLEKKYVFEELDKYNVSYEKKEFTIYYCTVCDLIYKENPRVCECGSLDIDSTSLCDIVGSKLNYGLERKKGSDLIHSLNDDRIYFQLQAMKEIFKGNAGLVFEGSFQKVASKERARARKLAKEWKQKGNYGMSKKIISSCEARIKQMLSIPAHCLSLGIAFIQVDDLKTLIDMLKYFDYKCGDAPKIREKRKNLSELMPSFVKQLCVTPTIGEKLATRIYKIVQKPEDFIFMLRRQPERIMSVNGLGQGKLKKLKDDWL